jgi:hypothetical protein
MRGSAMRMIAPGHRSSDRQPGLVCVDRASSAARTLGPNRGPERPGSTWLSGAPPARQAGGQPLRERIVACRTAVSREREESGNRSGTNPRTGWVNEAEAVSKTEGRPRRGRLTSPRARPKPGDHACICRTPRRTPVFTFGCAGTRFFAVRPIWRLGSGRYEIPAIAGISAMELSGLEPLTSWVRSRRSPN